MHKNLLFAAYGWLALSGILHFAIDVVSQHLRGVRPPGPERTLYYGLNTAYALGQLLVGLLALFVVWEAADLMGQWPVVTGSLIAAGCWLAFCFVFIEYPQPRVTVFIFTALVVAAAIARARG